MIEAYNLFHQGVLALSRAECEGIRVDVPYLEVKKIQVNRRLEKIVQKFKNSDMYRDWSQYQSDININSLPQLAKYLYEIKKLKPPKLTKSGNGSVDDDALQQIKLPGIDIILEHRKWSKYHNYINQILLEQVDGVLHSFFNLHNVVTYRSSSDSPNFQNFPKRDPFAMNLIRGSFHPKPGHQMMEVDFSGLEVSIAACYHKDPTMIDYLKSGRDFHSEIAQQIYFFKNYTKDNKTHKTLRGGAKNGFVFPQFYGDYYKMNAVSLCKWAQLPHKGTFKPGTGLELSPGFHVADNFIKNGIRKYEDFERHIQKIETHFWQVRFPVYDQWKKRWLKAYQKNGEFTSLTGFRVSGEIRKNQIINYPVQGSAFHCLLRCLVRMDEYLYSRGLKTRIIGQIHDSMVLDVCPEELPKVYRVLQRILTVELAQEWKWIIVPLSVEIEITPVDGSWNQLEAFHLP